MTNHPDHKAILHQRQLAASRQRGQNFLVHRRTAELIVELAGVTPEDRVVELGVGFGALTLPLAARAAAVIGLEIDSGIIAWHQDEQDLPANVSLRHEDLLKADFPKLAEECGGRLKIVANLPYSISNPLLFKLLENRDIVDSAVLMLQKEVAQRLTAKPATKEYGILTVLLNGCARVEKLLDVGPGQFHPRPKVDSVVVKITFFPQPERAAQLPPTTTNCSRNWSRPLFSSAARPCSTASPPRACRAPPRRPSPICSTRPASTRRSARNG